MTPTLHRFGQSAAPVVVIDGFSGDLGHIVDLAAALSPFPPASNYYPGLRRVLSRSDGPAHAYVDRMLRAVAPFIGGGFGADSFELLEASFSMVTAAPGTLSPPQRAPHFDSVDPDYLAVLHYLSDTPGTGTAFYRQRETGIERVTEASVGRFVSVAKAASSTLAGYTNDSNAAFERIGLIEGTPDRLIIYQGCLLHSGVIPSGMTFSADPRRGRLTANIFVRARRR